VDWLRERPAPERPPGPGVQAATDEIRARPAPFIRPDQAPLVRRWCDWTDEALAQRFTWMKSLTSERARTFM
jgi:hypothetical protein